MVRPEDMVVYFTNGNKAKFTKGRVLFVSPKQEDDMDFEVDCAVENDYSIVNMDNVCFVLPLMKQKEEDLD